MWIMLWVYVSVGGVLTSGAIDFPTKDACEDGRKSWGQTALPAIEDSRMIGHMQASCIQRATGKP